MSEAVERSRDRPRSLSKSAHEAITGIWGEILGVGEIRPDDDFFRLGGESLEAIRMLAALEDLYGLSVSFTDFVDAPTVEALAAAVESHDVSPEEEQGLHAATGPVTEAPMTAAQERLWFIEEIAGGAGAYNLSWGARLRGALDVEAFERALGDLVARHEALRSSFASKRGTPVQRIAAAAALALVETDLRGHADAESEAQALVDNYASAPIPLDRAPLARAQLIRLADDDHMLQLVLHHIICDGLSLVVVSRELASLYQAHVERSQPAEMPPPAQYSQHAERERAQLRAGDLEEDIAAWRQRLAEAPAAIDLPHDRPRPAFPSYVGAVRRRRIPRELEQALRAFAQRERSTVFGTLLAAYAVLLSRLSGQETVVVGTTTAGRSGREFADGIGLFARTVPLRVDLDDRPSFRELVGRVRRVVQEAVSLDRVPFERLVAEIVSEPDPARHPIFQVFLAQVPQSAMEIEGLDCRPLDAVPRTARFDLTLFAEEKPDGLDLAWEYSADLFDEPTIEAMERHLLQLLAEAIAHPERAVSKLPLLDAEGRAELLARVREVESHAVACLHERFEEQVRLRPDAVAVTFESETLTYRALNERANRLAHRLRDLGVGRDSLVALFLDRSADMVVAILATLKAGGAYVPLDPEYPRERIEFALEDTEAEIVLTQRHLRSRLAVETRIVCVDDPEQTSACPSGDPEALARPEDLAYVIYTSGSTGRPKGVAVEHRNVARLFSATDGWFRFGPEDTWLLFHSYAFDFSVWELWGALLYGGRLVVTPQWTTRSPEALASLLVDEGVTVFNVTPSVFLAAADALLEAATGLRLRLVVFGGEALNLSALKPWFERFGSGTPQLVNMYGITETTVHVTYRPLTAEDADRGGSFIGKAIPDLYLLVLDEELEPVPVGVRGEIYVGGAGLARGYLNRKELTAERFVSNPFGPGRLYRTGDLGRRLRDGDLEYLGRIDEQVKIRGHRIELGEVREVLREHRRVADAVVVPFEAAGDTKLAAYVVLEDSGLAADEAERVRSELWRLLERRLPAFMIPANLVAIDALPLTHNGKVDRKALPSPTSEQRAATSVTAPRNELERMVAETWRELLWIDEIGVEDNFFHLGGHSLLAARVVTRLREQLGVDGLSVRAVFGHPTLADFAEYLASCLAEASEASGTTAPTEPVPGRNEGDSSTFPVSAAQQQLIFLEEFSRDSAAYNAAVAVEIEGPLELGTLHDSVTELVRRHAVLRTLIVWSDDLPQQVVLDPAEARIEVSLVPLESSGRRLDDVLRDHARRPFDLAREAPLRVTVFRLAPDRHVVLVLSHHLVLDAWSVDILFRELGKLYNAIRAGRAPQLAELPLQYGQFAAWQHKRLDENGHVDGLAYWTATLAGAPATVSLPADRRRSSHDFAAAASLDRRLDAEVATAVRDACREAGVTPYMFLLAVFGTLLYRISGQPDILVGSPFANREWVEFEQLIGFFANTLALRLRMEGNPSFSEQLRRTRDAVIGAQEHQETPLGRVVEALGPARVPGMNPLVQVNFRTRIGAPSVPEFAGTASRRVRADASRARFDLALELTVLPDAIDAEFIYSLDLFDHETVEKWADDFEALLLQVLEDPSSRLLELELSSESAAQAPGRADRVAAGAIRRFRERATAAEGDEDVPPVSGP